MFLTVLFRDEGGLVPYLLKADKAGKLITQEHYLVRAHPPQPRARNEQKGRPTLGQRKMTTNRSYWYLQMKTGQILAFFALVLFGGLKAVAAFLGFRAEHLFLC